MKLRRIAVQNLRRFTAPVQIEGLADGLNVLSAPNEQGKSTLFDGLQALFFTPHGGSGKEIKALQPHAKGAPEALWRLGDALGALGSVGEACITLGEVAVRYPGSDAVARASASRQSLGCQ